MLENETLKIKKGYLKKDFQIFHLKDKNDTQFQFHYHNFNKIVVFISGNVTYLIEGKAYKLKPWDILLVNNNDIHKAVIDPTGIYERIIIWVNSDFLIKHNSGCNLLTCFELASKKHFNLLRLEDKWISNIKNLLFKIENAYKSEEFAYEILRSSLFLEFMVYINRLFLGMQNIKELSDIEYDERISSILNYINENLSEDLSIDTLSSKFYMSKYHLMHKFKMQTGYTIHNYILQKRLIMSNSLIKNGKSITQTCIECGFSDYSNFVRAFKKNFGLSPKKYCKILSEIK
ncbi:AraC family transcriptional regulator [Clostridium sp. P21]|uniref:AraC family transcriptional regulator n=1 Tax=Clostridium muellerianum TaxID=2716538 RepID=A0A7Y0EFA6_9CLOT|nr:AraC family transcriptional regulator [Clostridium muellerianum]NMM62316.1 AraC family transcriptional regulator [Clostridium muellerianum]